MEKFLHYLLINNSTIYMDRAQLLTENILKQGYVAPRLKSSLQYFCDRHYELVDRYEISKFQRQWIFSWHGDFFLSPSRILTCFTIRITRRVSYKEQELLILREHPGFFMCCVCFCVCLRPVSCVLNVASVSRVFILDCPFGFLLTFISYICV
jgi:hypothetical protein